MGVIPLPAGEALWETGRMTTPGVPTPAPETARLWAILCHLSLIIAAVLSAGYLAFVGPLIFWFLYRERDGLVRNAAAGSFNFAVTLFLASAVAGALQFTVILAPVGWIIWGLVYLVGILFPILAAMAASPYERYRYPLTLPLLS